MFVNKKILSAIVITSTTALYFYNKHMYEKELFAQMNYLLHNEIKLSGVYLQQRQPFGFLWYVQWILPYHQSLKIIDKDGNIRQVGLGKNSNNKEFFNRESEFVLHKGDKYDKLNDYEISIPIECWVDYKRKFGQFPKNVNVELLNKITMTREEANDDSVNNIYKTTCGNITRDINDDVVIISAVMDVIRLEELCRLKSDE